MINKSRTLIQFLSYLQMNRNIWLIVTVALFLRLFLVVLGDGFANPESVVTRPDSNIYISSARSIATSCEFNRDSVSSIPETQRPIGYPFFLALLFLVNDGLVLAVLMTCLLSSLICIPIFLAGKLMDSERAGILGAVLYALNVTSISSSVFILADTLFTFLVVWQFYFFLRFYKKHSYHSLWMSIIFSALATLVKPVGLLWIIPGIFLVLVYNHNSLQKRLIAVIGTIIIFMLIVFPWMLRNQTMDAGFVVCTNTGNTLYYHSAATLMSYVTGESAEKLRSKWMEQSEKDFAAYPDKYATEKSRMTYRMNHAKKYIYDHPLLFVRLHLQPMILAPDVPSFFEILGLTKTGRGTLDVLHREGIFAAVKNYFGENTGLLITIIPLLLIVILSYIGCAVQLLRWIYDKNSYMIWMFLAFVVYYLVTPGPLVMPRYQLPALPMICFMAGLGIIWIIDRYKSRKRS